MNIEDVLKKREIAAKQPDAEELLAWIDGVIENLKGVKGFDQRDIYKAK